MESSTSRCCPVSVAGLARSSRRAWIHETPHRPPASATRCVICRNTRGAEGRYMSSRCRELILVLLLCSLIAPASARQQQPKRVLRIASDPNNLPFSDDQQRGFENKIAELIARELNAD